MPSFSETWLVRGPTVPDAPTLTGFAPASPSSSNTPSVIGTAVADSTVRLYTSADCSGTAAATGSAAAFADPGLSVTVNSDQTTTYYATATDATDAVSACSAGLSYVEDSTAPAAPTISATDPVSPANQNSVAVSGSAEAGSTVRIYTTSDCSGSSLNNDSASTFANPGIVISVADDSTNALRATATDAAGNVSDCSDALTYIEDSTAPNAPSISGSTPNSPANDNSPHLTGSAQPGSTVRIYTTNDCTGSPESTGTAAALADTGLQVSAPADTTTTYYATAQDAAANTSTCSTGFAYTEDSTPPARPTLAGTTPTSPSNDNTPHVNGSAEDGSTVRLYTTADCSGPSTAEGSATTFTSPGLSVTVNSDQSTTFHATATDAANNTSDCSTSTTTYQEDSTAPAAPTFAGTSPNSPSSDNTPKVMGTAAAGSTVRLYTTPDCSGSSVASGTPAAFANPGLAVSVPADSDTAFSASATDAAGNVACSTTTLHYVEDSTAPAAPVIGTLSPANANRPSAAGTAEIGGSVRLYKTAGCTGAIAVTGTAAAFADPGLATDVANDTTTQFSANTTDAAGNVSPCSAPITYVARTTPAQEHTPVSPPARDVLAPTSTIAKVASGQRHSRRITLRGTAAGTGSAVQSVRISIARVVGTKCRFLVEDGTFTKARSCARTTYLTASGGEAWSLKLPRLAKGSYKVRSRAIDAAGNIERKDASHNLLRFVL